MTAVPDRLTRLARALAVVTTRPPVATASVALQLRNPLNGGGLSTSRGARMASNARRKAERAKGVMLAFELTSHWYSSETLERGRMCVVLTRVSPKPFDDDNNAAALKSVRDGMAEAFGINDADPRVTWVTDWRQGKAHAVEAALWAIPEKSLTEELGDALVVSGAQLRVTAPSDVEVDPSDWERPRVVVHGGLIQRREVRVTPNFIRAKGGV